MQKQKLYEMLEYMVDETGVTNILGVLSEVLDNRADKASGEKEDNLLHASDIIYASSRACDIDYTNANVECRRDMMTKLRLEIENL